MVRYKRNFIVMPPLETGGFEKVVKMRKME